MRIENPDDPNARLTLTKIIKKRVLKNSPCYWKKEKDRTK